MAATATVAARTSTSITVHLSGGAGTVPVPRATVLAACTEGPLKAYLTRLPTSNWNQLLTDKKVLIFPDATAACTPTGGSVSASADAGTGCLVGIVGADTNASFVLQFVRSQDR